MKQIIIAIFITLVVTSCNDDFIQRSSLTDVAENNFWQSEDDAFLALNGVYSVLQSKQMYGGSLNAIQGIPGFDNLTDNAFDQYKYEGPKYFVEGTLDPTHDMFPGLWNNSYQGIARVNAVIKNAGEMSSDLITEESKNTILGQAYFLRALLYFNLAVYYEDVPLITEPQTLENAYVPINTYAEITEQIVTDLKEAVDLLPTSYSSSQEGYATKGAALGLFARVQLYNKVYDGDYGVLALTQQLMGLGYSLDPDYSTLFTQVGENSPEIVFSVRFLHTQYTATGESFSGTFTGAPKVDQQPTKNLAMDFYCTDGLPVTESPLYNPAAASQKLNRDPRATATLYFKNDIFITDLAKAFNGNNYTGYGQKKYLRTLNVDAEGVSASGADGSQDFYVIRYADVLLMRAEAMAETNDISGATALVDQVRARVSMPGVESVEGKGTTITQDQMIEIVRHERRVELALEGLRFMDLKRWGTMEEAYTRVAADAISSYGPAYSAKSLVFPIPQSEMDVNPQLVQHPAWQ